MYRNHFWDNTTSTSSVNNKGKDVSSSDGSSDSSSDGSSDSSSDSSSDNRNQKPLPRGNRIAYSS